MYSMKNFIINIFYQRISLFKKVHDLRGEKFLCFLLQVKYLIQQGIRPFILHTKVIYNDVLRFFITIDFFQGIIILNGFGNQCVHF